MIDHNDPGSRRGILSLGRFAQAAGLTRKALRLYESQGILVPAQVDPGSGYRYYHPAQLERAYLIRLLREMEMPLADIARVLEAGSAAEAANLVKESQREFDSRAQLVLLAANKVLAFLGKENLPMSVDVTVQSFPAFQAVSIKKRLRVGPFQEFIPRALDRLSSLVEHQGGEISGEPICLYYGPVNQQDDGPVEICYPFTGQVQPEGEVRIRTIPAHQGAIAKAGPGQNRFPAILQVWDDVLYWVSRNQLAFSDQTVPCYEIWHGDDSISIVQPFEAKV